MLIDFVGVSETGSKPLELTTTHEADAGGDRQQTSFRAQTTTKIHVQEERMEEARGADALRAYHCNSNRK